MGQTDELIRNKHLDVCEEFKKCVVGFSRDFCCKRAPDEKSCNCSTRFQGKLTNRFWTPPCRDAVQGQAHAKDTSSANTNNFEGMAH